jgi:hypothetical protein
VGVHVGVEIIFFIKAAFFGLAAIILIPKDQYKKYLIYGLILGGLADFLTILVFEKILGGFRYLNTGVFDILNLTSFWTPIAWSFVLMYFLYALPVKKGFFYIYIAIFSFFGYCIGIVLEHFGLYQYIGVYRYIAPLTFIAWFYIAARLYMRWEKLKLQ